MDERVHPPVKGVCRACGWRTLFLSSGGYVTCSNVDCSDPAAVHELLSSAPRPPDPTPAAEPPEGGEEPPEVAQDTPVGSAFPHADRGGVDFAPPRAFYGKLLDIMTGVLVKSVAVRPVLAGAACEVDLGELVPGARVVVHLEDVQRSTIPAWVGRKKKRRRGVVEEVSAGVRVDVWRGGQRVDFGADTIKVTLAGREGGGGVYRIPAEDVPEPHPAPHPGDEEGSGAERCYVVDLAADEYVWRGNERRSAIDACECVRVTYQP